MLLVEPLVDLSTHLTLDCTVFSATEFLCIPVPVSFLLRFLLFPALPRDEQTKPVHNDKRCVVYVIMWWF
jgi:hypothetical protein